MEAYSLCEVIGISEGCYLGNDVIKLECKNMFRICLCDDCLTDRESLRKCVEKAFFEIKTEYQIFEFDSGDKLLGALLADFEMTIDILFLDIEMDGIDGIQLRNELIKLSHVWRIIFVSHHEESMIEAFGLKTVGFLRKPVHYDQVKRKIDTVLKEYKENTFIELPSALKGNSLYQLDNIAYFLAEGNYSRIFLYKDKGQLCDPELICCKLAEIETKCNGGNLLRIHKSYCVNLDNVLKISSTVLLRDISVQLPIGRKYKEQIKEKYMDYILNKARERF